MIGSSYRRAGSYLAEFKIYRDEPVSIGEFEPALAWLISVACYMAQDATQSTQSAFSFQKVCTDYMHATPGRGCMLKS